MSLRPEKAAKMFRRKCVLNGRSNNASLCLWFSVPMCQSPSARPFPDNNVMTCRGDFYEHFLTFLLIGRSVLKSPIGPIQQNLGNLRNISFPHSSKHSLRLSWSLTGGQLPSLEPPAGVRQSPYKSELGWVSLG